MQKQYKQNKNQTNKQWKQQQTQKKPQKYTYHIYTHPPQKTKQTNTIKN